MTDDKLPIAVEIAILIGANWFVFTKLAGGA